MIFVTARAWSRQKEKDCRLATPCTGSLAILDGSRLQTHSFASLSFDSFAHSFRIQFSIPPAFSVTHDAPKHKLDASAKVGDKRRQALFFRNSRPTCGLIVSHFIFIFIIASV